MLKQIFFRQNSSKPQTSGGLIQFFDSQKGWTWNSKDLETGRSWKCSELRIKHFTDLHKLWWTCLKQVNLLLSQRDEAKRFRLVFPHKDRLTQVKGTMKNIKLVLWERKISWQQATDIYTRQKRLLEITPEGPISLDLKSQLVKQVDSEIPLLQFTDKVAAAALDSRIEDIERRDKIHGKKRAKRGMFGFAKKQLNKRVTTWYAV